MILPVTLNSGKPVYPVFKNSQLNAPVDNRPQLMFSKKFENIKTENDFMRAQLDQNERLLVMSAMLMFAGLVSAAAYLFRGGKGKKVSPSKSNDWLPGIIVRSFESLKDNPLIPTLEECKSVNKDLRELLEVQVKQIKNASILQEQGAPSLSNRLLLYGPAGVGKSFFAKIFAKSLDADYMEVLYSDFNSKWGGEGVENLKFIFEKILDTAGKDLNKRFVVTFNEIDTIVLPPENIVRGAGGHALSKIEERSVFLNYMEILKERTPNVTVIGTTNLSPKNNGLDRAAMSRFQNLTEVPYPDKECLFEALKMNLKGIKNGENFIDCNEQQLRKLTEDMAERRFSFRNLENAVNKAKQYHQIDIIDGNGTEFKMEYLTKGEKSIKLSDGELEI